MKTASSHLQNDLTPPHGQHRTQVRLWRPQGQQGVEVAHLIGHTPAPPFFVDSYVFTVAHDVSSSRVHYRRQIHRLERVRSLLLTQHPGDLCRIEPSPDRPDNVSFLRIYPEAMARLSDELKLEAPLRFGSYVAPQAHNKILAAMMNRTVQALINPTSQLGRDVQLLNFVHTATQVCADAPLRDQPLGKEHRAIRLVKDLLKDQLEQDHTLEDLARHAGLSRVYLAQVFKRDVGVTPQVYQSCVRIARSRTLLSSGRPIADVALALGFFDQSHFTRVFRRYVGVTPKRFQCEHLSL